MKYRNDRSDEEKTRNRMNKETKVREMQTPTLELEKTDRAGGSFFLITVRSGEQQSAQGMATSNGRGASMAKPKREIMQSDHRIGTEEFPQLVDE